MPRSATSPPNGRKSSEGAIRAAWATPTAKASMCSTTATSQGNSTIWTPSGTNQQAEAQQVGWEGVMGEGRRVDLIGNGRTYIL